MCFGVSARGEGGRGSEGASVVKLLITCKHAGKRLTLRRRIEEKEGRYVSLIACGDAQLTQKKSMTGFVTPF